jgi:hypothetical protein
MHHLMPRTYQTEVKAMSQPKVFTGVAGANCQRQCKCFDPCPIIPTKYSLRKAWYAVWQCERE